jgi:glycosyltransferase involved in cell wall biosynthesis
VLDHTARHARLVIVPSHAAGDDVRVELLRRGAPDIPIHAAPLPITDTFIEAGLGQRPAPLMDGPYFVVCGALEPRKNHVVVFTAWRALAAQFGDRTPTLFVVGSRGSLSGPISVELDALISAGFAVRWLDGLSTPGLIRLLQGARALLMPSLIEGFGLPVAEALALGTPALVSDIPAHREAGGTGATYLPPSDSAAWVDAISSMTFDDAAFAAAQTRARATPVRSWPTYLDGITGVLKAL